MLLNDTMPGLTLHDGSTQYDTPHDINLQDVVVENGVRVNERSQEHPAEPPGYDEIDPLIVFVVLELYYPCRREPRGEKATATVQAVFRNLEEANVYAAEHVANLERLTKERVTQDEIGDEGYHQFKGYRRTKYDLDPVDGTMTWKIKWDNQTLVMVERQVVNERARDIDPSMPLPL